MCKWNVWQAVGEYVFGGGEGWSLSCIFGLKVVLTVRNCHCLNLEESYFFSPGFVEWFRLDGTSQGLSALSNSTQECCFVLTKTRFFCFSHMLIRNHVLFFILKAQLKSYGYFNFFFLTKPAVLPLGMMLKNSSRVTDRQLESFTQSQAAPLPTRGSPAVTAGSHPCGSEALCALSPASRGDVPGTPAPL